MNLKIDVRFRTGPLHLTPLPYQAQGLVFLFMFNGTLVDIQILEISYYLSTDAAAAMNC